jgi:uncharacterized protein (DUF983 family)
MKARLALRALVAARCPRCRQGPVFREGWLAWLGVMRERCPECGLVFLRETGYFLGAMYISYGLGVVTVLPVAIALVMAGWQLASVLLVMLVQTLISVPIFMRYSRLIWLHADQLIDPR